MSWLLRCEGVASPESPQNAIRQLVALALELQTDVIGDLNGTDVFVLVREFDGHPRSERVERLERAAIGRWEYQHARRGR